MERSALPETNQDKSDEHGCQSASPMVRLTLPHSPFGMVGGPIKTFVREFEGVANMQKVRRSIFLESSQLSGEWN